PPGGAAPAAPPRLAFLGDRPSRSGTRSAGCYDREVSASRCLPDGGAPGPEESVVAPDSSPSRQEQAESSHGGAPLSESAFSVSQVLSGHRSPPTSFDSSSNRPTDTDGSPSHPPVSGLCHTGP